MTISAIRDRLPDALTRPLMQDRRSYDLLIVLLAFGLIWALWRPVIVRRLQAGWRWLLQEGRYQRTSLHPVATKKRR